MKGYPNIWNKLIKKNLYTNNCIQHPKGINLGEDLAVIIKLFYFAKKIVKLNKGFTILKVSLEVNTIGKK